MPNLRLNISVAPELYDRILNLPGKNISERVSALILLGLETMTTELMSSEQAPSCSSQTTQLEMSMLSSKVKALESAVQDLESNVHELYNWQTEQPDPEVNQQNIDLLIERIEELESWQEQLSEDNQAAPEITGLQEYIVPYQELQKAIETHTADLNTLNESLSRIESDLSAQNTQQNSLMEIMQQIAQSLNLM